MTMLDVEPDAGLYDDEEREMLESCESAEWRVEAGREDRVICWREAFREARRGGRIGPVPYDVPYPWSKKEGE